jgi:hypothetical protein
MRVPRNLELGLNHGDAHVLRRINPAIAMIDRREVSFWFGKFFLSCSHVGFMTRTTRHLRVVMRAWRDRGRASTNELA